MIISSWSEKEAPVNPNNHYDIYSLKSMVSIDIQSIDFDFWV